MRNQLRELLLTIGGVVDKVGTRGYVMAPASKAELPNFVVKVMDTDEHETMDGGSELRRMAVDVQCRAATAQDANELGSLIWNYLKNYRGTAGILNPITIDATVFHGEDDTIEKPIHAGDIRTFVTTLDFDIFYRP